MTVELNHTIVHSHDKKTSAAYLAELLNLPEPFAFGPFMVVQVSNHVSLDFADAEGDITPQHLAFKVSEQEFQEIFGKIRERGLRHWADPFRNLPGEINTADGGHGVYFTDENNHALEILTRDYGSGS